MDSNFRGMSAHIGAQSKKSYARDMRIIDITFNWRIVELDNADGSVINLYPETGQSYALHVSDKLFRSSVPASKNMHLGDSAVGGSDYSSSRDARNPRQRRFHGVSGKPFGSASTMRIFAHVHPEARQTNLEVDTDWTIHEQKEKSLQLRAPRGPPWVENKRQPIIGSGGKMTRRERYLRTSEVAQRLQVSPKTVARWAKEGRLPYLATLGGHRRFPASAIEQLVGSLSSLDSLLDGLSPEIRG